MAKPQHDFHLVNPSPLPILTATSLLLMAVGTVMFLHKYFLGHVLAPLGVLAVLSCMFFWWKEVIKEGRQDKAHTEVVQKGLSFGMLLFILSEVMFFVVFFWAFFKAALDPVHNLDDVWATSISSWPPANIHTFDPWDIPFTNTLILLLSGTSVTWAHYALIENNRRDMVRGLTITVLLGMLFTCFQAYEYHHASFQLKDGIYPSVFYLATGFHGAHVIIGTIFLLVCLFRARAGHFDKGYNHLGFEFAAWYWHFVDVVWLFLFVFVYVWGR
jgi:cytochrome c oxidase subunit 3